MNQTRTNLVLGYDATCIDCSKVAQTVRREAGDHLEVVPLRSPRMQQWRRQAIGDDAPWAPTLVRVTDDNVEAWTGWHIAPVLARHLNAKTTWRILGALGGSALDNGNGKRVGISRSAFLRGAVGSLVGFGILMKTSTAATASTSRL